MLFCYQKYVFLENQTHPVHSKRGKEHIRHKTDAQNSDKNISNGKYQKLRKFLFKIKN